MSAHDKINEVEVRGQKFLKRLDSRYCIPDDIEIERIVYEVLTPNNDGGTACHYEYVCIVREILT